MRKRRILPARCPSTSCPLSSFTRNIRLGRASVISPSNSTFSSTAMQWHLRGAENGFATSLVAVYPHAGARDQGDSLPKHLLELAVRRAQLRAPRDAAPAAPHLRQREARPEAPRGAPAEGQPRVGVRRALAEEALGAELLRAGVA